jgi:glycosyltransferase involved in cell wall biosynthesis
MSLKPMRISMLYTPLTTAGGAERQFLEELRALRTRGHHVTALTFELRDQALFIDGVARDDVRVLSSRGGWPGQVCALRSALRGVAADVLVSHTSPELTWLTTRASRTPYVLYHNSPPFYIGEHANPYMASRRYRAAYSAIRDGAAGYEAFANPPALTPQQRVSVEARTALKHRALRDARAVIVPSERTAHELRLLHGVEATVVRGCLPASLLANPPGRGSDVVPAERRENVVLSVCRLEPVKRVDLLLRAFAIIRHAVPDARLIIAGTGSDEPRLRALTSELRLDDAVRFAGHVPEDQLWPLYAQAKVLAAPAMADFIIAPYEAMAMGARAVWTTEMETDPAIEASGQVFVAAPEPQAFAVAIGRALRARDTRRADLRSMTWDARGARIEEIAEGAARRAA